MRRLLTRAVGAVVAAAGCQSNQAMKDGTMASAKLRDRRRRLRASVDLTESTGLSGGRRKCD